MSSPEKIKVFPQNCVGCLTCQLACSFTFTNRFNPSDARIIIEWSPDGPKINFTKDCTDCGVCTQYCFYGCLIKAKEGK